MRKLQCSRARACSPASPRKTCLPLGCVGRVCRCDVERHKSNACSRDAIWYRCALTLLCINSVLAGWQWCLQCVCTWWISLSFYAHFFRFVSMPSLHWQHTTIFSIEKEKKKEEEEAGKNWSHASYLYFLFTAAVRLAVFAWSLRWKMSVNSIKRTFESSIRIVEQWDEMSPNWLSL